MCVFVCKILSRFSLRRKCCRSRVCDWGKGARSYENKHPHSSRSSMGDCGTHPSLSMSASPTPNPWQYSAPLHFCDEIDESPHLVDENKGQVCWVSKGRVVTSIV